MKGQKALLVLAATLGLVYEAVLLFTSILAPYRFPIPYAVPIFDTPFVLGATGVGYLCLERHRVRHDMQSAALGISLWLAALLALAHILAQPDYPGAPGINPGVAPYLFFVGYLVAFGGVALAIHHADRRLALSDRSRWMILGVAVVVASVVVATVFVVRPLLPPLVMPPGRLTPFAIWTAGLANGAVFVWALWAWRRRLGAPIPQQAFVSLLILAAVVWLAGLLGFLLLPYRYGVSWYLAGVARPLGIGVIFVALLREQVWLYREARGRLRDLEQLHEAGQALVSSLDTGQIAQTIAARALTISQADAVVLLRADASAEVLRALACAGTASRTLDGLELPIGRDASALAVAGERPVWYSDVHAEPGVRLFGDVGSRLRAEGLTAILAVPLLAEPGKAFGALWALYRQPRSFSDADVELLSAYGTQASAALENVRSFDRLALKAMHDADLQDFGRRLLEATTERQIVNDAVATTQRLLYADRVALFLTGADGRLDLAAGTPPDGEMASGDLRLGKEPLELQNPPGIVVPLGVGDRAVGALVASYDRGPRRFTTEEQRVITSLAHQISVALEKARLYAELQANLARLQETQAQLIQADKLTALGTLLSGMAHELNNPLSTIRLSVELVRRTASRTGALDAALAERLAVVDTACARAARIVGDLLIFTRRQRPERRRVDLNELIQSTLNLHAPQLELNKIRLATDLEPTPAIWADAHQLQQVLLNLVSNAIHAMKTAHGHGTLTVRSAHRDSEVIVDVEDDGPGIAPEHLGRIFDPFFTTKGTGAGTGLGLSLSIGIVEAHGGHMRVDTVAGAGTRFTVHLPVGHAVEPEAPVAPPPPLPAVGTADVLVVEDEGPLRGLIVEAVRDLGHHVVEATTGQEALDRLQTRGYDLVILDLRLPDVEGQAIWHVALAPDRRLATRVIFMTGDIMSGETQRFLDEAGRPVLIKPFTIEQVSRAVSEVLAGVPSAG
jgi:two-component system NtrC family sensor kinase